MKAEGVVSNATGDTLTIALLDTIAIHWLITIDNRLVHIVKTEFAAELKQKRLCQMIKVIAPNIDELLARYNSKDQVSSISVDKIKTGNDHKESSAIQEVSSLVRRIERLESTVVNKSRKKFNNNNPEQILFVVSSSCK